MPRFLLSALAALLLVPAGCMRKAAPEPVLIGQLVPLSGPQRSVGLHARQGAELAVIEAVEANQAVEGRKFNILHVDDHGNAQTVEAETVRLLTVNKVAGLLADSDAGRAEHLARAAQPYGVPVVVPGEWLGPTRGDEVLALGARPAHRGEILAHYAAGELKAKVAVLLTDSHAPVAAALATAFSRAWPKAAKSSVEEWAYAREEDHAGLVKRVTEAGPDVVLIAGSPADFRRLRELLDMAKVKAALLYGGADVDASTLARRSQTGAEVYLATAFAEEGLSERGKAFAQKYEARFREKPDAYAFGAYDAARLLFGAMHEANSITGARVREQLGRQETFESVTGPVTWKDRQPRRRLFVVRLAAGSAKLLKTVDPEK